MGSIHQFTLVMVLGLCITPGASVAVAQAPASTAAQPRLTDFISPDFCMATVVHLSQLVKSPAAQAFGFGQGGNGATAAPGALEARLLERIKPEKIRRVVVLLDPTPSGNQPFSQGAILQFEDDTDSRKILEDLQPGIQSIMLEGRTCLKGGAGAPGSSPTAFFIAGPRMLLLAPEPTLKKMLVSNEGPRPLLDQLRRADFKCDVVVEMVAAPLAKLMSPPPGSPSPATPQPGFSPATVLADIKTASVAMRLEGPTLLNATIRGTSKGSADKLFGLASMFKAMASQQVQPSGSGTSATSAPPPAGPMAAFAELVQGLEITRKDNDVVIAIKMPKDLPSLAKRLADAAQAMIPMAAPGSSPSAPGTAAKK